MGGPSPTSKGGPTRRKRMGSEPRCPAAVGPIWAVQKPASCTRRGPCVTPPCTLVPRAAPGGTQALPSLTSQGPTRMRLVFSIRVIAGIPGPLCPDRAVVTAASYSLGTRRRCWSTGTVVRPSADPTAARGRRASNRTVVPATKTLAVVRGPTGTTRTMLLGTTAPTRPGPLGRSTRGRGARPPCASAVTSTAGIARTRSRAPVRRPMSCPTCASVRAATELSRGAPETVRAVGTDAVPIDGGRLP